MRPPLTVQDVAARSLDMGRCGWCFGTQDTDERWTHSGDCPLAPHIEALQVQNGAFPPEWPRIHANLQDPAQAQAYAAAMALPPIPRVAAMLGVPRETLQAWLENLHGNAREAGRQMRAVLGLPHHGSFVKVLHDRGVLSEDELPELRRPTAYQASVAAGLHDDEDAQDD
jgi:hypothetical protein